MTLGGFLSWVEAHPNLPSVLSYYLQLAVNMFLGSLFIYIVYSAWAGVMTDVDIESSKHASEVMVEIAACATEYNRNRCRPEEVVPAMEKACGVWETCMNRDPKKVARASVTAKTFAMIFNSFVEEFSYKSMVCCFLCSVAIRWASTLNIARLLVPTSLVNKFDRKAQSYDHAQRGRPQLHSSPYTHYHEVEELDPNPDPRYNRQYERSLANQSFS
jgi:hypothetical protein